MSSEAPAFKILADEITETWIFLLKPMVQWPKRRAAFDSSPRLSLDSTP